MTTLNGTDLPALGQGNNTALHGGTEELASELAASEAPGINTLINGKTDLVLSEALGSNVLDTQGNRYIDLISGFGVALLGHRHPRIAKAIERQAKRLVHGLGDVYANPPRIALARALAEVAPQDDAQVYFAVSGADAIEIALKTAVLHTRRQRILAFDPGYHGLTMGALQVTSRPAFREPFASHSGAHVTRMRFGCDPNDIAVELAAGAYAAVVFEPIVGREGVLFPPEGWINSLLELCAREGTVSIADEIFTGLRRTGPWFAHQEGLANASVAADLICCGKALGGGLPIGAVLGSRALFLGWDTGGEALHTGTFVGHPLACAAGLAVLEELKQPWVAERLTAIGAAFTCLQESGVGKEHYSIRGRGALWAIECRDRIAAQGLQQRLRTCGLLTLAGGPAGSVLQLVPALSITNEQLDYVIAALREQLALS